MSNLLNNLITSVESKDEKEIVRVLNEVLKDETHLQLDDVTVINQLLNIDQKGIQKLTTQLIAEIAKNESRNILTQTKTIQLIVNLLNNDDPEITFNVIRAVGNICYENEEACIIIEKLGLEPFLKVLKDDCTRVNNQITTKLLGLLMNIFTLHDELCRSALQSSVMTVFDELLLKYATLFNEHPEENKILVTFLLSVLSALSDYFNEQGILFKESSCKNVIDIFKVSDYPEISVPCLEIFHSQSERDEIKTLLAKEGVCELLFYLIEKHRDKVNDEGSRSVMKTACDLIVVILTGDDCMYMLYNSGEGRLYKGMISWLDSNDDDLVSTGVLAIGNFARKDTNCIQMVKTGISKRLLNILSKYNTSTNVVDVKMQHALLSTLKNLVIPKENKAQVLQEGLIDVIYPMIKIDQFLVIFKLLGTFRMVIDGQDAVALDLISRTEFIEKLTYWCYGSDHLGVRGEVPRLLAWLIKNCHSLKPFESFIKIEGSVKCLVEMISSNHALMQNEAFHALNLLYIGCSQSNDDDLKKFLELVIEADIGKNLNFILNKYGGKMDKHTVENLLTLLDHLVTSNVLIDHLNKTAVKNSLLKISYSTTDISDRVNRIISILSD